MLLIASTGSRVELSTMSGTAFCSVNAGSSRKSAEKSGGILASARRGSPCASSLFLAGGGRCRYHTRPPVGPPTVPDQRHGQLHNQRNTRRDEGPARWRSIRRR